MDKETDALLKIARERENKKDLLAYQKLKEISTGRTYSEAQDILDRMGKQLSRWVVSAERIRVRLARPQSNAAY